MKIEAREFEAVASTLRMGQRTRAEHCGMGEPMQVSNARAGFAAYCHRCGGKGFIPHQLSLSERLALLADAKDADSEARHSIDLPEPRVCNPQLWPTAARLWLYKAGMSNDQIEDAKFYYHERTRRVVMPVYDKGRLVYWQARGFVSSLPKYLNPVVDRTKLVAKYGQSGSCLVLTEDILSAMKVSRVHEAWALMGTNLHDAILADIIRKGVPVMYMGDPDAGGDKGWRSIHRRLGAAGIPHYDVRMEQDPKRLSVAQIRIHLAKFQGDL